MAGEHRFTEKKDSKMGRTKFPGRPSKIPNRRRVNLSSCELPLHNDSSKAAESICRGLFVFNEAFGDSGLAPSSNFAGFSSCEVEEAMAEARLQQRETETEYKNQGIKVNLWSDFQNELYSIFQSTMPQPAQIKKTNVCFDGGGKCQVKDNELNASALVKTEEKSIAKLSPSPKVENIAVNRNSKCKASRKLVLPKSKSPQTQAAKKLLMRAKKVNIMEGTKSNIEKKFVLPKRSAHSSRVIKPNKRFFELQEAAKCNGLVQEKQKTDACQASSEQKPQSIAAVTPRTGKVILREARLQFNSSPKSLGDGPFSSPSAASLTPAQPRLSTMICGVCGTVRAEKFVRKTRKYGIFPCDDCRKFISKMVQLRESLVESGVKCLKGTGMCMSPPAVWSSPKVDSAARCEACWLKVCLRNFKIKVKLKHQLQLLLPSEMRGDALTPGLAKANLFTVPDGQISFFTGLTEKPKVEPTEEKREEKPVDDKVIKKETQRKEKDKNGKRKDGKKKRQRVPLPGPRVKHVCRSASVALGQPVATFSDRPTSPEECCDKVVPPPSPSKALPLEPVGTAKTPLQPVELVSVEAKVTKLPASISKPPGVLQPGRKKKNTGTESESLISLDFWEIYDPDEVCKTGFSLIGSESFSVRALCYLCGSAGSEKMVHCASCCEPYHAFCLNDSQIDADTWRFDWVCPRCTLCATCGRASGQQLHCVRCENSYHTECAGGRLFHSPDRPWICPACLRCKSCSATEVSVFVGNLPLCKHCFELRQRGNFCPLCQRCYAEDDFECKMMECGVCQRWVHAKCEGVSDEKYQVLSFLPESVEYICRMCCAMPPAPWWLAVEAELKAGYLGVLKSLSKNRTACRMLKWSPRKICSCRRRESLKLAAEEDSLDSERRDSPAPASDSGISSNDDELKAIPEEGGCFCFLEVDSYNSRSKPFSPNLLSIKKKVTTNEYSSLSQFHADMISMIETTQSEELVDVFHSAIREVFPWFDPKEAKVLGSSRSGSLDGTPIKSSPMKTASPLASLVPVKDLVGRPPEYFYNDDGVVDTRSCLFCKAVGDGGPSDEHGRLLYCGQNEWVHCNCALWSGEVFEEIDGSLQNVHSAISRGRSNKCAQCQLKGASVGCCVRGCPETYHFSCARAAGCIFLDDKSTYCKAHASETAGRLLQNEKDFALRRPVYVELDKRRCKPVEVAAVRLAVGAFQVESIGRFVPELSDLLETIMPADFCGTRIFWSSREPWRLVRYRFSVRYVEPETFEGIDLGVNLTVDHSRSDVEARLRQLRHFQQHHTLLQLDPPRPSKRLKRRVFDPLDEPDNQDLLPPDLEEAILKELSHDMLEGISVQDIFQDMSERERDDDCGEEDLLTHQRPRKTAMLRSGNWNLKADKPEKSETKWKRKTQEGKENKMVGWCTRLLQVDGTIDSSSGSEAGESPGRSADMPADIPQLDGADDSDSECDGLPETDEAPVECGTCRCTYRTQRSYERHLESRCHDLLLSSSEEEEEPSPPPPPPAYKPAKPRTYARKKPVPLPTPPAPAPAPPVIIPPSPVPMILQEMPTYQPLLQYIVEQQKPLLVPNTYQVVLPPSPVVLGTSSPMFEVVTDPNTGGMFLAQPSPQPMLYNMETIVSNTVMQTNQFVSSSFSQTSTQVFQASKLEQVVNMPTGYVLAPNDLICVPVSTSIAAPQIRTQWTTPPRPKQVMVKQEIPPRPPPPKVKPRSRALVDYINNFMSDTPELPNAVPEGYLKTSTSVSKTTNLPSTVCLPVTTNFQPHISLPVPASLSGSPRAAVSSTVRRPVVSTTVRKTAPPVVPIRATFPAPIRTSPPHGMPVRASPPTPLPMSVNRSFVRPCSAVSYTPQQQVPVQQLSHKLPPPPPALSISMPSLDDSPPVSCDNSPALLSSVSVNLPVSQVQPFTSGASTVSFASLSPVHSFTSSPTQRSSSNMCTQVQRSPVQSLDLLVNTSPSPQVCLSSPSPCCYSQNPPSPFLSPRPLPAQPSPLHRYPSYTPPLPMPVSPSYSFPSTQSLAFQSPQRSPLATYSSLPSQTLQHTNVEPPPPKPIPHEVLALQVPVSFSDSILPNQEQKQLTKSTTSPQPLPPKQAVTTTSPLSLPPPRIPEQNSGKPLAPLQSSQPASLTTQRVEPIQADQNKPCLKEVKITPRIVEPEGPKLVYDVVSDDGFKFSSTSLSEVWQKICESVHEMRAAYRMPTLPMAPRGHEILAMNNHGVQHILEQLPGVGLCNKYQAKYFKQPRNNEEDLTPVKENLTGCARSEGYSDRKESDKFGWLASRHRELPHVNDTLDEQPSNRRTHNLPMAMRYRQLREAKQDMVVYRSKIHGMGLFCLREIDAGEMVIEYSGELIRSALTDKREKLYTDKGIGCYMFRIDDHLVIDATMKGNAARFINHSCEPNCYSKIVDILGKKHIIIFALRKINVMEELTYDYKFPFEEIKISCHCQSKKCRKYLN